MEKNIFKIEILHRAILKIVHILLKRWRCKSLTFKNSLPKFFHAKLFLSHHCFKNLARQRQ